MDTAKWNAGKPTHYLKMLLAWEAGEITIGQAKMLMELWDGEPVDYVDIRKMRECVIAWVQGVWDAEFRDRHVLDRLATTAQEPQCELGTGGAVQEPESGQGA